jgi:hypothetical protein
MIDMQYLPCSLRMLTQIKVVEKCQCKVFSVRRRSMLSEMSDLEM